MKIKQGETLANKHHREFLKISKRFKGGNILKWKIKKDIMSLEKVVEIENK